MVALVAAAVSAPCSYAFERALELERVAGVFANRAAEVRCPDAPEWQAFADEEMGADDPELVFGVTHLFEDWIMLRPDLCMAAARITDEAIHPTWRAAGVLSLVHEAYHVRRWGGRRDEAKVECAAVRHFRVAARLLGASAQLADRLFYHARFVHYGIANRMNWAYYSPWCTVPD